MKKSLKFIAIASGLAAVACSSPEKMAEQAENVIVTCDPAVLEVVAGEINATVTVTYPEDYFNKKAILEVTPVIVYEGGEQAMEPYMFQGTSVKDNYEVVPSEGATVSKPVHFTYVEGMEKCYLELRGVAKQGKKSATLPSKKAADGANTTYMLACKAGRVDFKADNYQEVIAMSEEGQIMYNINSSDVKNSELKGASVKNFLEAVEAVKANERKAIKSTDIIAYASPDGGEELNTKLSDKRSNTAEKAFNKVTKKAPIDAPVNVKSVGQDWEGFQELVAASQIEDKDLIIRVLSMYSDPEVREKEIKNMSAVYTTLAKEVLPELRRARFIANVEFTNYSSEELLKLVDENSDVLDEEALLRAATLVEKSADKIAIYKKAAEKYDSARAKYNIAVVYAKDGKDADAKKAIEACDANDADVQNVLGVLALRNNDLETASKYFAASNTEAAVENAAVVDIWNGKYADAVAKTSGKEGPVAALAAILVKDYNAALKAIKCDCPYGSYLKAIVAARQGKAEDVKTYLDAAKKCDKLAKRAEKDVEFAQYK